MGISRMQYQYGSSASPCVTGWLLTGDVALITIHREVRQRSSFRDHAPSLPIRVPLIALLLIISCVRLYVPDLIPFTIKLWECKSSHFSAKVINSAHYFYKMYCTAVAARHLSLSPPPIPLSLSYFLFLTLSLLLHTHSLTQHTTMLSLSLSLLYSTFLVK